MSYLHTNDSDGGTPNGHKFIVGHFFKAHEIQIGSRWIGASGSNVISASNLNREILTLAYDGSMGLGVTQPQGVLLNIKPNDFIYKIKEFIIFINVIVNN